MPGGGRKMVPSLRTRSALSLFSAYALGYSNAARVTGSCRWLICGSASAAQAQNPEPRAQNLKPNLYTFTLFPLCAAS